MRAFASPALLRLAVGLSVVLLLACGGERGSEKLTPPPALVLGQAPGLATVAGGGFKLEASVGLPVAGALSNLEGPTLQPGLLPQTQVH